MKQRRKEKKVFEVLLTVPEDHQGAVEIIRNFLCALGVPLESIIEQKVDQVIQLAFYCSSKKQAGEFVERINQLGLKGVYAISDVLYQDDWLTRWKKDWKPFALTKTLDVVPVWCKNDYVIGRKEYILLDTISSFGTGLHETTRFMAQFIERLNGKFNSCLDVGTGTGILSLVALKNGAKKVHAIDLDEMCIHAAQENFKANGYPTEYIRLKNVAYYRPRVSYDLVAANLVTHDLIQMKQKIVSLVRPGGWLAVSGISLENLSLLKKNFQDLPLNCIKILKGKCWSALLFRRH